MTETVGSGTRESYRQELHLRAAPEAVAAAFTTLQGIQGWWTEQVSGSAAEGGELTLGFPNSDGPRVVLHVDTADPAGSVVWSVRSVPPLPAWEEWAGTRIVVSVRPAADGGTMMGFEHEGLTAALHCYDTCSTGWDHGLAALRRYVETSVPRAAF